MSFRSLFRGWIGEVKTSLAHKLFLNSERYRQFNNVTLRLPDGSTTQIDHLIISKFGIFVIETKSMSGWIYGSERDRRWTQCFPTGQKFSFQNPIRQNHGHVMALIERLGLTKDDIGVRIHPVVNFGSDAVLKTMDRLPEGVLRGGEISYIKSKKRSVFTDSEVETMVTLMSDGRLPHGFFKGWRTRNEHVKSVRKRHSSSTCPKCGGSLTQRHRKRDGEAFVGCSTFPKCRYMREGQLV